MHPGIWLFTSCSLETRIKVHAFHSFGCNIGRLYHPSLATLVLLLCFINSAGKTGQMRFGLIFREVRDDGIGESVCSPGKGGKNSEILDITGTDQKRFVDCTRPADHLYIG